MKNIPISSILMLVLSCIASIALSQQWSIYDIDSFHKTTCAEALHCLETWEGRSIDEITECYMTLAALRSKDVKIYALENMTFGLTSHYKKPDNLPFDPVLPFRTYMIFSVGQRSILLSKCPAFFALENCGMPFADVAKLLVDKQVNFGFVANSIIATLSTYYGGEYAKYLIETDARIPEDFSEKCKQMNIDYIPCLYYEEYYAPMPTEKTKVFKRMEEYLVERLKALKAEGLSLDTIRQHLMEDTVRTMGHIRSLKAVPLLTENLTVCPQVSTNAPSGYVFPAAEALIEIGPAIGYCFGQLEKAAPLSVEESLWLRISHELYPEGLEYDLMRRAETNDLRAARLLDALPWRRLDSDFNIIEKQ